MSGIEWTDITINPLRSADGKGYFCEKVSRACRNCYASRINEDTFRGHGNGVAYPQTSGEKNRHLWGTGAEFSLRHDLVDAIARKSSDKRIFVCSMTDMFHPYVPDEWLISLFAAMRIACLTTFQVLTKQPERMMSFLGDLNTPKRVNARIRTILDANPRLGKRRMCVRNDGYTATIRERAEWVISQARATDWPPSNIWFGTSVENEANSRHRLTPMQVIRGRFPSAVLFVSYEPAVGSVDWTDWRKVLDWLIAGGESGPNAEPSHMGWFTDAQQWASAAGVPFFFKQWGEWKPVVACGAAKHSVPDREVRRFRGSSESMMMRRVGKAKAGRNLIDREWSQFPDRWFDGERWRRRNEQPKSDLRLESASQRSRENRAIPSLF